jgi:hypothetical protein
MKPTDYKAIAAWGRMMGSQGWYTDNQQTLAAKDGAPIDAIYRKTERNPLRGEMGKGDWRRLSQVKDRDTQHYFVMHHPDLAPQDWKD